MGAPPCLVERGGVALTSLCLAMSFDLDRRIVLVTRLLGGVLTIPR
jgi:hypothetical protein